jgi:hypothetical protein
MINQKKLTANIAGFNLEFNFSVESDFLFDGSYRTVFTYLYDFLIINRSVDHVDFYIDVVDFNKKDYFIDNKSIYRKIIEKQVNDNHIRIYSIVGSYDIHLVIKYIMGQLLDLSHSLVLHSSAVLVNHRAYLFVGGSGAGKSTIVKMLSEKYKSLCDDNAFIKKTGELYSFFQTPYYERYKYARYFKNLKVGKIFFLQKSKETKIERAQLLKNNLLDRLFEQIENKPSQKSVFDFLNCYRKNLYLIHFSNTDLKIADLII